MDDRPDAATVDDVLQPLHVSDIAGFPGEFFRRGLAQHQGGPAPIIPQVEGDHVRARPLKDRNRPGSDAPARAGHQHRALDLACINQKRIGKKVHHIPLLVS